MLEFNHSAAGRRQAIINHLDQRANSSNAAWTVTLLGRSHANAVNQVTGSPLNQLVEQRLGVAHIFYLGAFKGGRGALAVVEIEWSATVPVIEAASNLNAGVTAIVAAWREHHGTGRLGLVAACAKARQQFWTDLGFHLDEQSPERNWIG